jgi:hypothetical protein
MPRTADELNAALKEQVRFLQKSGTDFDAGDISEAKRIVGAIHILLHDKGRTISILSQMGTRDGVEYLSSAPAPDPRNLLPSHPLIMVRMGSLPGLPPFLKYQPIKDGGPPGRSRWLPFAQWWDQAILKDQYGLFLSRKELVLTLRDKDGGGHFDSELDDVPTYIGFTKGGLWKLVTPEKTIEIDPYPHLYTMRQIGWELEQSLERA